MNKFQYLIFLSLVYETSADWIKKLQTNTHSNFVVWSLDRILKEDAHVAARVVGLAMVLRSKPDALKLSMLMWRPKYHGEDKLPLVA
ncbi:unnamed protein product [Microthlaspi erraticum]|uniref:Uncharacterized protein n=1 Tax=Microthlaspi erraticum TaxID=1685480 RepID=A0A6D2IBV7_9BRAS|nr:unnamed protein product [Microthlaspi erraticum]